MNETTCPHCGKTVQLVKNDAGLATYKTPSAWERLWSTPTRFESAVTAVAPQPAAYPETPRTAPLAPGETRSINTYRTLDPKSDVITPLLWASAGGTLLGLAAIPVTVGLGWPWWVPPSIWPVSSAALFFAVSWRVLWDKFLIAHEETLERQPPPAPPTPQRSSRVIEARLVTEDGRQQQYAELPDTRPFWELARAVVDGASFAESTAAAHGMPLDVTHFQEPDEMGFCQVRDRFIDRHWARWRNRKAHKLGVKLNGGGMAMLVQIASAPPPQE